MSVADIKSFKVGGWHVEPDLDLITREAERVSLRSQVMELLVYLASRPGEVVSVDVMHDDLWAGKVVTTGTVYNCVAELRHALAGDDQVTRYIETVPKKGYRLVAPVTGINGSAAAQGKLKRHRFLAAAAAALIAAFAYSLSVPTSQEVAKTDSESVAVLPFADVSAAGENAEFLAFGIHDDLLTILSRIKNLKVISRTSVERYGHIDLDLREIGTALSVNKILRGSVQRAGDRIRISVQLVEATSGEQIWADSYDRELSPENLFAIQREIASAIANALHLIQVSTEKGGADHLPTQNMTAYNAYLLGKQAMATRMPRDLRRARTYFEEAVTRDPKFALAHVGRADSASLLANFTTWNGGPEAADLQSEAEAAARSALELNRELGEAYAVLGYTSWQRRDFATGEEHFKKALALSPNYADAYRWYAHILWDTRREKEALQMMLRGTSLDPLSPIMHGVLGDVYGTHGRPLDALASYERALEIDPQSVMALQKRGSFHIAYGEASQGILWLRKLLSSHPSLGFVSVQAHLATAYRHLGAEEESRSWSARALDSDSDSYWTELLTIANYHAQGRYVEAARFAETALASDPECNHCVAAIGDYLVMSGQPIELLRLIEERFPDFPSSTSLRSRPRFQFEWVRRAAWALLQTGQRSQAESLIGWGLELMKESPRIASYGFGYDISDASYHALLGNQRESLRALRHAVDAGWRYCTHICGNDPLSDPAFDSVRSEPKFVALRAEIAADLALQHQWLLAKERQGELPPVLE